MYYLMTLCSLKESDRDRDGDDDTYLETPKLSGVKCVGVTSVREVLVKKL